MPKKRYGVTDEVLNATLFYIHENALSMSTETFNELLGHNALKNITDRLEKFFLAPPIDIAMRTCWDELVSSAMIEPVIDNKPISVSGIREVLGGGTENNIKKSLDRIIKNPDEWMVHKRRLQDELDGLLQARIANEEELEEARWPIPKPADEYDF